MKIELFPALQGKNNKLSLACLSGCSFSVPEEQAEAGTGEGSAGVLEHPSGRSEIG